MIKLDCHHKRQVALKKLFLLIAAVFAIAPAFAATTNEDKAIDLVRHRKEVQAWSKLLLSTPGAGQPCYMVTDHKGDMYTVQASESRADRNITFRFYDVNVRTKAIKSEL